MEISITGHFEIIPLLKELNRWFGTIQQQLNIPQIGYYIHSNKEYFQNRTFPSFTNITIHCSLSSIVPNRAYVATILPTSSFQNIVNDLLMDTLLNLHLFKTIREKFGFGYFVKIDTFHSILFKGNIHFIY